MKIIREHSILNLEIGSTIFIVVEKAKSGLICSHFPDTDYAILPLKVIAKNVNLKTVDCKNSENPGAIIQLSEQDTWFNEYPEAQVYFTQKENKGTGKAASNQDAFEEMLKVFTGTGIKLDQKDLSRTFDVLKDIIEKIGDYSKDD